MKDSPVGSLRRESSWSEAVRLYESAADHTTRRARVQNSGPVSCEQVAEAIRLSCERVLQYSRRAVRRWRCALSERLRLVIA